MVAGGEVVVPEHNHGSTSAQNFDVYICITMNFNHKSPPIPGEMAELVMASG